MNLENLYGQNSDSNGTPELNASINNITFTKLSGNCQHHGLKDARFLLH